jgi:hypothetical protein
VLHCIPPSRFRFDYYVGLLFLIVATIHIAGKACFRFGRAVIVAGGGHLTRKRDKVANAPGCRRLPSAIPTIAF